MELVEALRGSEDKKLPGRSIVTPEYLSGTLGYSEVATNALFAELQKQHVVSKEKEKLGYAVIAPEDFRQIRVAAGQVAVGSVVERTRRDTRRINKMKRYSRSPFSWKDLGNPSMPVNPTTHIRLSEDAPLYKHRTEEPIFERRLRERQSPNDPLRQAHDSEYLTSEAYWPKMVRKVAAAAALAAKRKSDTALLSATAFSSTFKRDVDKLDAELIAGDAYAKFIKEGVLKPVFQRDQRSGRAFIARYEVIGTEDEILNKYSVSRDELDDDFQYEGDEPWREIADDPDNLIIFRASALRDLSKKINAAARPQRIAKLEQLNQGKSGSDRLRELPEDENASITEPHRRRLIDEYLANLGVSDEDGEIADAVYPAMQQVVGKLKQRRQQQNQRNNRG